MPLLLALALTFIVGTNPALAASSQPTVRWMTVDLPPLFMVSGPEHGVGDYAQGVAVAGLNGYSHVLQAVPPNYQRIELEIKSHDDVCFAGFLKNPARERFMVFSEPYLLMLPVQLFVPRGRPQPPVDTAGQIDLSRLLGDGGFRLGILGGRRYGATVDSVIDTYTDNPPVYRRFSKDQLAGLVNMMTEREHGVDGVLAYASEINYLQARPGAQPLDLRAYPLKGGPAFLLGYFACSKSALGKEVIARINQTIPGIRAQVAGLYARDLTPEVRAAYAQLIKAQWGLSLPAQ